MENGPATHENGIPDDQDVPCLSFTLEEDPHLNAQLSRFSREPSPVKDVNYRRREQQLLNEGKHASGEFTARLQQARFGTFKGEPSCLVIIKVDFAAKNSGWARFRRATIEMEVEEPEDSDDDDDDDEDDDEEAGVLIRTFYPDLIRGHIQTAAETYGITFEVGAPAPVPAKISAGWGITSPREAHHLVHGLLGGTPETRVKWDMHENEVSKNGLYEQPVFAIIVSYREDRGFVLGMKMKATTYAGLAVRGKGGARIRFARRSEVAGKVGSTLKGLSGGSVTVGSQTWSSKAEALADPENLQDIDLEGETQMRSNLLAKQGPGGGTGLQDGYG